MPEKEISPLSELIPPAAFFALISTSLEIDTFPFALIAKSGGTYSDTQGTYNGNYEITSTSVDNLRTTQLIIPASITIKKPQPNVLYKTHVQDYGWQNYVKNYYG